MSITSKIQSLITAANSVTGESRTDLTAAVQDLKDGYGQKTLPSEYQRVDYIEASGNQYIDIGYYATAQTVFEVDCAFTDYNTNYRIGLVAGYSGNSRCAIGVQNTGKAYFGISASNINPDYTDVLARHTYKVSIPELKGYIDGVEYATGSGTFSVGSKYNGYLFAVRGSTSAENKTNGKLYGARITTEFIDQVFVPCYRKSDNVIGLFDITNQKFYTNAGTGNFTCYPSPPTT